MCRVVTWNLWWRFGDWSRRLDAISAALADEGPDVVGLQEVWATGGDNAARTLADRLGLHWAWAASPSPRRWQRRIGDESMAIGNAVLSRWPIVATAHADLPTADGLDDGRTVLHAGLDTPHGTMPFFTTQLSSAPGRSGLRCAQVRALTRFVACHGLGGPLPPVVTGDFNAEPASDEIRLVEGALTEPAVPGLVLVDAWRYAAPHDPGLTWARDNPHVAATGEPSARIDYVLVGLPRAHGAALVTAARLLGNRPRDGVWPSDHAGVVAELLLAEPPRPRPGAV